MNMILGNREIKNLILGSQAAKSAWLGDQLVWSSDEPAPPYYPTLDLKLHFDAIDNAGVGTHSSSTTEWANIAPGTSADYKLHRDSGTWEADSAVFTGAYNDCFWLQDIGGT